jgi:hypothetical protein
MLKSERCWKDVKLSLGIQGQKEKGGCTKGAWRPGMRNWNRVRNQATPLSTSLWGPTAAHSFFLLHITTISLSLQTDCLCCSSTVSETCCLNLRSTSLPFSDSQPIDPGSNVPLLNFWEGDTTHRFRSIWDWLLSCTSFQLATHGFRVMLNDLFAGGQSWGIEGREVVLRKGVLGQKSTLWSSLQQLSFWEGAHMDS